MFSFFSGRSGSMSVAEISVVCGTICIEEAWFTREWVYCAQREVFVGSMSFCDGGFSWECCKVIGVFLNDFT